MDLLVERDHVLDVISGADVPRFARVIEKRRIATPAVGIAVRVRLFLEKKTAGLQVRHDFRIGILEEFARIRRHGLRELAARVEGVNHREVILQRSLVVVFPVSGGHMNDAGSVACRDKVAADHVPTSLVDRNEAEPPFVFFPDEIAAGHAGDDLGAFRHE